MWLGILVSWKDRWTAGEGLTNLGLEDGATSPSAVEAKHFHDDILVEVEIRGEILSEGFKFMQVSTNRLDPAI
jgi:hypothetical protein